MTAEERAALVERVARAIAASEKFDWDNPEVADFRNSFRRNATAAIDLIRGEVLEEAAKVAEREGVYPELNIYNGGPEWYRHGRSIAAAIRALKEKQ